MTSECGSQRKGPSAQTRRKERERWRIRERDWAWKMVALTPPPWRKRRRGRERLASVGGVVVEVAVEERVEAEEVVEGGIVDVGECVVRVGRVKV